MDDDNALRHLVGRAPKCGALVIVEDDLQLRLKLECVVAELGFECLSCGDGDELVRADRGATSRCDGASIDWRIHDRDIGDAIVSQVRTLSRHAACMVYTKYHVRDNVRRAEVEYFVPKPAGGGLSEFKAAVLTSVCHGMARKIASELGNGGDIPAAVLKYGLPLDDEQHQVLCRTARATAFQRVSGARSWLAIAQDRLVQLLVRRGWWQDFDSGRYLAAGTVEKLQLLAQMVGLTDECLWQSLDDTEPRQNTRLPDSKSVQNLSELGADRRDAFFKLLAVLSRLLESAAYQPEYMQVLWANVARPDAQSDYPWSGSSLRDFISRRRRNGVNAVYSWMSSGGVFHVR